MARIEQRICDRCSRRDEGFEDHGWSAMVLKETDFDLCRGCSTALVSWIAAGHPVAPPVGSQSLAAAPAVRQPVVAVDRIEPPRG